MAPLDTQSQEARDPAAGNAYLDAWHSISRSMESGVSWSGHERNVAWLNAGDGTFVEASAVAGFDHEADGRVVCRTDWDRDGDVDLWLRSRNGATLRYLENQSNPECFVELSGADCGERVSATFGARDGGTPVLKRALAVPLTDGYMAAPSRRMTFAVPKGQQLLSLCGQPVALAPSGARRFRFEDGCWVARAEALVLRPKLDGSGSLARSPLPTRTVLRSPLLLPPIRLKALGVPQEREPNTRSARLLLVRSSDCPTCESVLPGALKGLADGDVPVEVVEFQVSLDLVARSSDHGDSAASLRTIVASILGPGAELALPLSILIDAQGAAQVIYQGDLDPGTVSQDADQFVLHPVQGAFRAPWGTPVQGCRWFHGSPRALASLCADLTSQGLTSDADFYNTIARNSR